MRDSASIACDSTSRGTMTLWSVACCHLSPDPSKATTTASTGHRQISEISSNTDSRSVAPGLASRSSTTSSDLERTVRAYTLRANFAHRAASGGGGRVLLRNRNTRVDQPPRSSSAATDLTVHVLPMHGGPPKTTGTLGYSRRWLITWSYGTARTPIGSPWSSVSALRSDGTPTWTVHPKLSRYRMATCS